MTWMIPAAMVASAVIAGAMANRGQKSANSANLSINSATQAFNAAEAQKARDFAWKSDSRQMNFQRNMAANTYQRAMADMERSGLNPILAYKQGGAPAPSGASSGGVAASHSPIPMQNEMAAVPGIISSGMNSALNAVQTEQKERDLVGRLKTMKSQRMLMLQQEFLQMAMNDKTRSDILLNEEKSMLTRMQRELTKEQIREVKKRIVKIAEDTLKIQAEGMTAWARADVAKELKRLKLKYLKDHQDLSEFFFMTREIFGSMRGGNQPF